MIESDTTELKRELNDKLEKEVVAFLNTKGGDIFIGVDDKGGVIGVENVDQVQFPYKEDYSEIIVTPPVTPPVNAIESNMSFTLKQMVLLLEGEMSKNDLMQSLRLKDTKYFKQNILQKAIKLNLIELTQPNSPNSPTQKYRLTPIGESLKKSLFQQEK